MFPQKRTLFFLTITVTGCLLLAARQAAPAGAPVTSDSGENITIVIAEDPPSFNPMVADTGYDAPVMKLVMLGLTDVDPQGDVFPELAAELPTAENGGVTIDRQPIPSVRMRLDATSSPASSMADVFRFLSAGSPSRFLCSLMFQSVPWPATAAETSMPF